MRASVIVPVYNRRAILEKTLAALCTQRYPRALFEVIVADDGSHDRPEEIVPQFRDALNIRIVRQEDKGFRVAAVRNLAIAAATGDVIVSLDCDMLPSRGWLRAMLAPFHVYDGPLCVIGYRRNVDTTALDATTIRRDVGAVERLPRVPAPGAVRLWWAPSLDWRVPTYWRSRMLPRHGAPFSMAAGGNLAYRTRDALAVGLHDESFSHWGGEDDEFAYRLYRQGAYFVPVRRAVAYHQAHDVGVPREQHRRETRRLLGLKVPRYRQFIEDGTWETPKVSVYIRAAGEHRSVGRAIESALAQTMTDLDVCVSVDESAADIVDALAPYAEHPRVRVLRLPHASVSAASNATLRTCKGELILQMTAADELLPDAAARLAQALDEDTNISVASGGCEARDARGHLVACHQPVGYSAYDHLHGDVIPGPRMFRARDLWRVGGWDEALDGAEDYDLSLRICERGLAQPIPRVLARREHTEGLFERDGAREGRAHIEAIRRALTRRHLPAHVEPFDRERPDRIIVHFDRHALAFARLRRRPRVLPHPSHAHDGRSRSLNPQNL